MSHNKIVAQLRNYGNKRYSYFDTLAKFNIKKEVLNNTSYEIYTIVYTILLTGIACLAPISFEAPKLYLGAKSKAYSNPYCFGL